MNSPDGDAARHSCTHPEVTITEEINGITEHFRVGDGEWEHNNEPGTYNRKLRVSCGNCGLERIYWRGSMPQWLERYVEELGI